MNRLSLSTLPTSGAPIDDSVVLPRIDPRSLDIGLVHLGVGAFHRAHQAVYTQRACELADDHRWGTFAVTGRSAKVVDQLRPQDGLYGVLTKGADRTRLQIVGGLREVACGSGDPTAALARLADRRVSVVTLTITEKGYPRTAEGGLAVGTAAVRADVDLLRRVLTGGGEEGSPGSSVGLLTAGLAARFVADGGPLSVLSCDNLPGNGLTLRRLVRELASSGGADEFARWIDRSVTFPATMVDRIVPATTERDRAEAERMSGLRDAGLVVAEPFRQWVIEDRFAGSRPAWEKAGAILTDDVEPYEKAKLRMLNGTHSLLAYLGALYGHRTIAEAARDPHLAEPARALQREDAQPTLTAPAGMDLDEYGREVLERFRNPHLPHTTLQVAMDGSQKLPIRLLGTAADRLRAGAVPHYCALAVAAWMVFVHRGRDVHGRQLPLDDPLAATLQRHAAGPQAGLADRMFDVVAVFDAEIAGSGEFRAAVRREVAALLRVIS